MTNETQSTHAAKRTLIALALLLLPSPAQARDSGIQITHEGPSVILIQKDVGSERWAITVSLEQTWPLEMTGNVFRGDGSAIFLQCRPVDLLDTGNLMTTIVYYSCSAADTCRQAPCDASQWRWVANVELPGAFLLP